MNVVAVVPSHEEEGVVDETVRSLFEIASVGRVIVVDDASTDGTSHDARDAGAELVVNGFNLGKGKSLNRVLPNLEFDVLLLVDGDLGKHAREAELLLKPVLDDEADLAIAAFPPPARKGGFGLAQGLGQIGIERLGGKRMVSPLSGQRALTREVYSKVAPFEAGFGVEVGMSIDALRAGFRVVEVQTSMSHRETARDLAGFLHRGRQFLDILRALSRRLASGGF